MLPLEIGGRRDELERRVGDDDGVPIRGRGAGEEALALLLGEVGLVRDEDAGVRIEREEFAAGLGEAVAGDDHHRLGDEAESLLLHQRGGDAEGLAGADGVGDVGRACGDDPPDDALLVVVEADDARWRRAAADGCRRNAAARGC